jgi:hypothetical protein
MFHSKHFRSKIFLALMICFGLHGLCQAQDSTAIKLAQEKMRRDSVARVADSLELVRISKLPIEVLRVYNYNKKDSSDLSAGIGDIIIIEVQNLDSLLRHSKAAHQDISLYINGRKIDNIAPISGAPDKDKGTLQYRLDRNTINDKTWADILGSPPFFKGEFFREEVKISVGLANEFAMNTSPVDYFKSGNNFELIRIHKGRFWLCSFLLIVYLLVVIFMAKNRGLLSDRKIDLTALGIDSSSIPPTYSLARFQMAFWFTLTIISFFFIWLITDAYDIITPTILALIGISAGTSLSAAIIDNSKGSELLNQTVALQNNKINLDTEISNLEDQIKLASSPDIVMNLQAQKKLKEDKIAEISPVVERNTVVLTPQKSEGFFNDILKDVNGVSFHRLQMFVWTVILGLIFLYSVWKSLSMPEFSATLLALQGLTAGTYLGFKFPEKQA